MITPATSKELNRLIDNVTDAFEEYVISLEDDANFWEAVDILRQYIKTLSAE